MGVVGAAGGTEGVVTTVGEAVAACEDVGDVGVEVGAAAGIGDGSNSGVAATGAARLKAE